MNETPAMVNTTNSDDLNVFASRNAEGGGQILDEETRILGEFILSFVTVAVSVMGAVTNSINLRVFFKQGIMSDSTTIGFFFLAVADLLACCISLPHSACLYFKIAEEPAQALSCHASTLMTSQYPRIIFSRISCWISVYISVERCLCVLIPLKVKLLIRPKLTLSVMISIYTFFAFFHLPLAVNTYIGRHFNAQLNQTVLVASETPLGEKALYFQSLIGTTILSSAAVVIVTLTTGLLIYKLNVSRKWSKSVTKFGMPNATSAGQDGDATKKQSRKRDLEVMKTVSAVTALFLACLTISHIPALASLAIPGFSITGSNRNLVFLLYNFKFLFDTINSASNFFFYINISSRYKAAFDAVFKGESGQK